MSRRGTFGPTLACGLAGAGLATAAATRTWAEARTRQTGLRAEQATGVDVAPLVLPLALVALAVWGTVLVLRRRGRRLVAVLGVVAAVAGAAAAALDASDAAAVAVRLLGGAPDASTSTTVWPWVAVGGCVLSALASAVAIVQAPAWPEMSARYDAPTTAAGRAPSVTDEERAQPSEGDLWKALDAGHDPTV